MREGREQCALLRQAATGRLTLRPPGAAQQGAWGSPWHAGLSGIRGGLACAVACMGEQGRCGRCRRRETQVPAPNASDHTSTSFPCQQTRTPGPWDAEPGGTGPHAGAHTRQQAQQRASQRSRPCRGCRQTPPPRRSSAPQTRASGAAGRGRGGTGAGNRKRGHSRQG